MQTVSRQAAEFPRISTEIHAPKLTYCAQRELAAFKAWLNKSGKVCLKPWCWRRFSILFETGIEPPWLSSWWSTTSEHKRYVLDQQLAVLAQHPMQFHAAVKFLKTLSSDAWMNMLK